MIIPVPATVLEGVESSWEWLSIGSALHLLAFLLVLRHCLRYRREPTSALLWIFIAWSFPVIGPLAYVTFGVHHLPRQGARKQRSDAKLLEEREARAETSLPLAFWQSVHDSVAIEPSDPAARELNSAMNRMLTDYPLLSGNALRILITGDEAYPEMLAAIRSAKHHIHLQTFILRRDLVGREFMELLAQKAASGVRVRVLFDRFGSTQAVLTGFLRKYGATPNLSLVGWTQARLIKRQFRINLRNHRKVLLVDGREAFTGGINLSDDNTSRGAVPPIQDYHFHVRGPIVQELQYSFMRDWYFMSSEPPDALLREAYFPDLAPVGDGFVRVVNSGPASEMEAIRDVVFSSVVVAKRQVLAVTPYFVPPPDIVSAFRSAALRGVDVRLVVPKKNNHRYAGLAGQSLYEELLEAGVRIFERPPPFLHAKALIVDDTLAVVGTANLDIRSLRLNYETDLAVYSPTFVPELKNVVLNEIVNSVEIELATWRRRSERQRLLENFCHLFSPIL